MNVCVFAGSRPGSRPSYCDAAHRLADAIAERNMGVVYGGGNVGLMNEVAERALSKGAPVIGVIPEDLQAREVAHEGLTELYIVDTMLTRKQKMADLSAAFVALPGGLGTLDEIFEMLTWTQLSIHHKRCGVLNVDGFYDPLLGLLEHNVVEGFMDRSAASLLRVDDDVDRLLDQILGL